jgi:DNA-binding response OmpR family regulator
VTTTLLAVDDSKTMRKVLEITFAGEAYRTVVAKSGDEALGKLQSDRPAVALVDAALGGDNGYEVCRKIKQAAPGVGVIILSSKHQPYDKGRGDSAGADDHIDKPFDTQQLIDKVGTLLRRLATAPRAVAPAPAAAQPAPTHTASHVPATSGAMRPRASTLSYGAPGQAAAPGPAGRTATVPGTAPPAQVATRPSAPGPSPTAAAAHAPIAPTPVTGVQLGSRAAPAPAPAAPAPAPAAPSPAAPAAIAAAAIDGGLADRLAGLGLTKDQVQGVLALSREVVEQVVWEVVPILAETLIKEEIKRLTSA